MERAGDDLAGGDARTLSFAAYRIDGTLLDRLLEYQRSLLDALRPGWNAADMAAAHARALATSGLGQEVVERALAVLRRFAGNRAVTARLRERLTVLPPDGSGDLQDRLGALERELRERDDPDTIALLEQREPEVVELHRQLARLLGA